MSNYANEKKSPFTVTTDPRLDFRIRNDPSLKEIMDEEKTKKAQAELPTGKSLKDIVLRLKAMEELCAKSGVVRAGKGWESMEGVERKTVKIGGMDKNIVEADVYTPSSGDISGTVVFFHGGGFCMYTKASPVYVRAAKEICRVGLRVVVPDFRSSYEHPFPAQLHDCYSALLWAADKFGPVVLFGDSAGGTLICAAALFAKRRGELSAIKGVWALDAAIYGCFPDERFPSIQYYEGGYGLTIQGAQELCQIYSGRVNENSNPLAWPGQAAAEELKGLPPHMIHVNEADMLRDENKEYYRKLIAAGVNARYMMVGGTTHDADLFYGLVPELTVSLAYNLKVFAQTPAQDISRT
uniref:Alpha/beta hydrolase fold-3 domain-containing protein n=1 Tax=Lotharella globosa TaxID=91324 RepID=A0A7S3ZD40_9EUKA|mmetsp:Transcript_6279/g.12524  ORF Transcript_6279/g.12524 Transcript_6279/m.12524 type:complete len:353 (+) Transcript_6279:114-1172(+)|eukprot:CAMPEP_0167818188 /NCGR_PEP_ID=MMETSP0112_2-20121227/4655_1 /TAXON_ID=91324 /ORGANISM="Lotharella globosa, Strain CCCM811" /LENGTH=352 /DNA_ID=CAMNT_0007718123 /DNA_START=102 /DNA_END=1160 /DNA_ORIENTATION=+